MFMENNGRWVYESYNHCFTTDKIPDLSATLGELYKRSEEEIFYQTEVIQKAKEKILANEEERRQAAKAAAAKKKGKAVGKKDAKDEEEEKKEELPLVNEKKELDLFLPKEF
jgi:hypothetical protein